MEKRLYIIFALFIIVVVSVYIKLFYWQVLSYETLRDLADRQTLTSLKIPAKRGTIISSDGTPLVLNQRAYSVFIEPKKIKNMQDTVEKLAKILQIPEASLSSKLFNTKLDWLPLTEGITEDRKTEITKLNLVGIGLSEQSIRYYPESSMAAHLLGFVGKNTDGSPKGYFGLEGFYDEQLRGRDGLRKQESDAKGNPILAGFRQDIAALDGRDIKLTIDKSIQYLTEIKLKEGIQKYQAVAGSVVIMSPSSGAILAMASYPSYEPENFNNFSEELYKNPVVASSYEPGSTFKVLMLAATLNEEKVKEDMIYDEDGPIMIGGYTIKTWNQKYRGKLTLKEIIQYSSNVGMVFIANKLGNDGTLNYLNSFGFGVPTDIDLQDEASPIVKPKENWYEIDYATVSFGQGIAVTPLQMIRAVAAIANGGKLVRPFVVTEIIPKNSDPIKIKPKIEREILKKDVTKVLTEIMVYAVENGETKYLKPSQFRVAGKTGTAQIPISGHYDSEKTIASFVGFAPAEDPKFIMLVTLREPSSSPWGSETAAPLFFSIAKELFPYLNISPSY